jgi:preprotein translocase subunit YajC
MHLSDRLFLYGLSLGRLFVVAVFMFLLLRPQTTDAKQSRSPSFHY